MSRARLVGWFEYLARSYTATIQCHPAGNFAEVKVSFSSLGIAVSQSELGYPFLIWNKRTGPVWLTSVLLMHIGIGLLIGMYLFVSIMVVLNLAAFGPGLIR